MSPVPECRTIAPPVTTYALFFGKFKRCWDNSNGFGYSYVASFFFFFCNDAKSSQVENRTNVKNDSGERMLAAKTLLGEK